MERASASMTQKSLLYLRDKIQNCQLMPGETLSEKELCEEIGCGRTPVREALLSLRGDGLVEISPSTAGWYPRPRTKPWMLFFTV